MVETSPAGERPVDFEIGRQVERAGGHRAPVAPPDEGFQRRALEVEAAGEIDVAADIVDRHAAGHGAAGKLPRRQVDVDALRLQGQRERGAGQAEVADLEAVRRDCSLPLTCP